MLHNVLSRKSCNKLRKSAIIRSREFYPGEFIYAFKDVVADRAQVGMADCKRAINAAETEADEAATDLNTRLAEARAAGDRAAEHEAWKEREARQAARQLTIEAASRHVERIRLGQDACKNLASALGFPYE